MAYKHINKAQDFVNMWTTYLKLPMLFVIIGDKHSQGKKGAICVSASTIILWKENILNRKQFVRVLLHEIGHWFWYYYKRHYEYKDESRVIEFTNFLIKEFYPSYTRRYR